MSYQEPDWSVRFRFGSPFSSKRLWLQVWTLSCDCVPHYIKMTLVAAHLNARFILVVTAIGIKISFLSSSPTIVQELCESRGGRPGLSVLTRLLVSVDVKIYGTVLRHWAQLVPNISADI